MTLDDRSRVEVKIPFGRTLSGTPISVDAVERGLACECFCFSCGARLVARKGEQLQHHFAHYAEPENCVGARETSIHRFAKHIICEAHLLRLPDDLVLGVMRDAQQETWLDGIRPDVLAQFDEPVAIEIYVAHRVPHEKISTFVRRQLAALEIDLSTYRNSDKTESEWRDLVLRTAPRFWLFPPAIVRAENERQAKEQADREQRERDRIQFIQAARRREVEWQQLVAAEHAERRKFIERRKRFDQEREADEQAEAEYRAYTAELRRLDRQLTGVNEFSAACSICTASSDRGWGVGLRKDWQSGAWYCLDHRPWNAEIAS